MSQELDLEQTYGRFRNTDTHQNKSKLAVQNVKNYILSGTQSNEGRSGGSMQSVLAGSLNEDQNEFSLKKVQPINSISNTLQSQMDSPSPGFNSDNKHNTGQFGSQLNSNSDEKMYGSGNQEFSVGHLMKLTIEKQSQKSHGAKQSDKFANSGGSFQAFVKGGNSDQRNPFAQRNGQSPINSLYQTEGTFTGGNDGLFKKSGGGNSYDAQNETHNFPGNIPSRLVNHGSNLPIPNSGTQVSEIESMSSDLQAAEGVDLQHPQQSQPVTEQEVDCNVPLTINDLQTVPSSKQNEQTNSMQNQVKPKYLGVINHSFQQSPREIQLQQIFNQKSSPNYNEGNKQFTVHDYNRQLSQKTPKDKSSLPKDSQGYSSRDPQQANLSRGKYCESPNLGNTKLHQTIENNTDQLTDMYNPLENLTQTQEIDDYGHTNKIISSVSGSVSRTDPVQNSVNRTDRTSNEPINQNLNSTPRASRDSLFRNQVLSNQSQYQGQGGNNPGQVTQKTRGNYHPIAENSFQNLPSNAGDQKPSNATYSKISERSVSSLGQAISNKGSQHRQHNLVTAELDSEIALNVQKQRNQVFKFGKANKNVFMNIQNIDETAILHSQNQNLTQQYIDSDQYQSIGIASNHFLKNPFAQTIEFSSAPKFEDVQYHRPDNQFEDTDDQKIQSYPKFQNFIKNNERDPNLQQFHLGLNELGDSNKYNNKTLLRQSIEIKSAQTPDSQFIGQETCNKLFLNEAMLSPGSIEQQTPQYQYKEDLSIFHSPQRPQKNRGLKPQTTGQRHQNPLIVVPLKEMKKHYNQLKNVIQMDDHNNQDQQFRVKSYKTNQEAHVQDKNAKVQGSNFNKSTVHVSHFESINNKYKKIAVSPIDSPTKLYGKLGNIDKNKKNKRNSNASGSSKKNLVTFKNDIQTLNKKVPRSTNLSEKSSNEGGHIRVQLLKDRDSAQKKNFQNSQNSESRSGCRFNRDSIGTLSSESSDTNSRRHLWTYLSDSNDKQFIQIFTPASVNCTRRPSQLMEKNNNYDKFGSCMTPKQLSRPQSFKQLNSDTPKLTKISKQTQVAKEQIQRIQVRNRLEQKLRNANQDLDTIMNGQNNTQNTHPNHQKYPQGYANQLTSSSSKQLHKNITTQNKQSSPYQIKATFNNNQQQSDKTLISDDNENIIDSIMAKNKAIINEQQQILVSYQTKYHNIYEKYKHFKNIKFKQLKTNYNQLQRRNQELEDYIQNIQGNKFQKEQYNNFPHNVPDDQQNLPRNLRTPQNLPLNNVRPSQLHADGQYPQNQSIDDFSNKAHNFDRHNQLKTKLYDKINDLAWKYRSKLETGVQEDANGRQLPVQDLWRWFKLMYKVWRRHSQRNLGPPQNQDFNLGQEQSVIAEMAQAKSLQEGDRLQADQDTKAVIDAGLEIELKQGESRPKTERDKPKNNEIFQLEDEIDTKTKQELQSVCSKSDSKVNSLQKLLCVKFNIDSATVGYQEKKNQIIQRVEELLRAESSYHDANKVLKEQLAMLCQHLQINEGIAEIKQYIHSQNQISKKRIIEQIDKQTQVILEPFENDFKSTSSIKDLEKSYKNQMNSGTVLEKSSGGPMELNQQLEDSMTRAKLDKLESQLKNDPAVIWTPENYQDSFLINAAHSQKLSKDSGASRLFPESYTDKQSQRQLSMPQDTEGRDASSNAGSPINVQRTPSSSNPVLQGQSDQNIFNYQTSPKIHIRKQKFQGLFYEFNCENERNAQFQKEVNEPLQTQISQNNDSENQVNSNSIDQLSGSQDKLTNPSSFQIQPQPFGLISLESQIKEESVEESREDLLDSFENGRDREFRQNKFKSKLRQSVMRKQKEV